MRQKKLITYAGITLGLLIIDLLSKHFLYDLNPHFNTGIARSIPIPPMITIIVSSIALALFIILFFRKNLSGIVTSLLVAGTLGNIIDRICLGGVRDFIDIQLFNFPIFNVADIILNLGIIIFLIQEIFTGKRKSKK